MNHVYRIVFNKALGVFQVVAETATRHVKGRGKGNRSGVRRRAEGVVLLPLLLAVGWAGSPAQAAQISTQVQADTNTPGAPNPGGSLPPAQTLALKNNLPTGGSIVAGSGSISQDGTTLTVTQGSDKLIANWTSFDIGAGYTVNFLQPSRMAVALNRVLGSDASQIFGNLNANGQVFLINPHGVLFGNGAQMDVGGLVASTLDIRNDDFLAGRYQFRGNGGSVSNAGSLHAHDGGAIALLGGKVSNTGVIEARLGSVALAAGSQITLDFAGDGLLNAKVDAAVLNALVENHGVLRANGGSILMTADAGNALLQTVVNNTGLLEAQTLEHREGNIVLLGGFGGGTVNVAGTLDASAPEGGNGAAANGGFIETSGAHVKVADAATITTKAANGSNGKWLIDPVDFTVAASGGDMTGAALSNALTNGDVEIQSTTGAGGVNGDVNIKDTVSWSQNTLTLNAQRDINVFSVMNASGTAGLFFKFNQADAGGQYNIYAPVNLASTSTFQTQSGSAGAVTHWTILTSLGAQGSTTSTDLQGMSGNLSGNYVLGADIDASGTATWNGGLGFTPIGGNDPGASTNPEFTGHFDGLGHVIDGLTINTPNNNIGLFGSAFSASIANIGLTHASITGQFSVGGLAGRSGNLHIHNSYVSGAITGATAVGGLVGNDIYPRGTNVLEHVWTAGSVTATAASTGTATLSGIAGGLIGHNAGEIRYSYSTADVRGGNYVGGLVGSRLFGSIDKSYFAGTIGSNGVAGSDGTVKAPYAMGALVGSLYTADGVVSKSYWNTDTAGAVGAGSVYIVGTGAFNGVGLTTAQMHDAANWTGFDFTATPSQNGWVLLDGVMPMLASEWSSYIRNAHQLQLMGLDLSADYVLANDIDASATNGKDVWLGSSFSPVGTSGNAFTGSFNGNDHAINGLTINRSTQDYVGLFGYANGALSNVWLEGGSITGRDYVGALAGSTGNAGSVQDSQSSASVSGGNRVGGLVGRAVATISGSHASGNVTASGDQVGGLVGQLSGSLATVTDSYAEGDVQGGNRVGGLVGEANAAISGSHATGNVTGSGNMVGGLVGVAASAAPLTNNYAEGDVKGVTQVGGLAGYTDAASSGNHASGNVTGTGNYVGGLIGIAHASITDSWASGDVEGVSRVGGLVGETSAAITDSYATGDATGSGDYVGGLAGIANGSAATITDSHAEGDVSGAALVGGLVGAAEGVISGSHASGQVTGTSSLLGGLVGQAGAAITNSYATGDVSSSTGDYLGGLVGQTIGNATVSNSHATGNVTSNGAFLGGLVGFARAAVSNSHAQGNVTGSQHVGGLLGRLVSSSLGNSYATGTVSGAGNVGGLAGSTNQSSINNSYATGNATSTGDDAGGLVGDNGSTSISNSYASGDVSGVSRVGGLVGNNTTSTYSVSSDITSSYANGRVTGSGSDIGGLVGKNRQFHPTYLVWYDAGTITGSFWNTETTGQSSSAGGGTGITTAQMQQLSTFVDAGWDISDQGGDGKVWRIYEGSTAPLLRSFMQQLTVTAPAGGTDKTYDGHIASGTLAGYTTSTPADAGLLLGTLGYATTSANAGTYSTANGTLQLGGLHSTQQGYDISYAGNSSLTINKAALTVTANNASKTYDATAWSGGNGVSYSGFVNGEDALSLGGTLAWGGDSQGAMDAGHYAIRASGLSSGNYAISYVDGTLTIDPKALAIVGTLTGAVQKTYDGTTTATLDASNFLLTGWVGSDGATVTQTVGYYDNANAGVGKTVTVNLTLADYLALGSTNLANYILPTQITGNVGIINQANLVIGTSDVVKTYDGTTSANGTATVVGGQLFGTDSISGGTFAYTDKNAGTGKIVTVNGVTVSDGNNGGNYAVTYANNTSSTINQANLVIGTSDVVKTYDGTTAANGSATVVGGTLYGSDTLSGGTFAYTDKNAGTGKTVTVNGVTISDGNNGGNYAVTYANNTTSTINQANLVIGTSDVVKTYDGTTSANGTATVVGGTLFGTDSISGGTFAYTDKNAGTGKTVTVGGVTINDGNGGGNYAVTYANNTNSIINQANLVISTSDVVKTYDGTTSANGTATVVGGTLFGTDSISGGTFAYTDKNAGTGKTVTVGGVTVSDGNNGGNYAVTYANNTNSTINQANLVIGTSDVVKTYDGTTAANGTATVVGGQLFGTDSLSGGTFAYTDKNAGAGKTVTVGGVTISDGNNGGNYAVTYANNTTSTINKALATVTANSSHVYYNGQYQTVEGFTATGLVNGETEDVLTGVTESGGRGKDVGRYVHGVSGSDGNYALTFVDGALDIDASPNVLTGYGEALNSTEQQEKKKVALKTIPTPYQVVGEGIRLPDTF